MNPGLILFGGKRGSLADFYADTMNGVIDGAGTRRIVVHGHHNGNHSGSPYTGSHRIGLNCDQDFIHAVQLDDAEPASRRFIRTRKAK